MTFGIKINCNNILYDDLIVIAKKKTKTKQKSSKKEKNKKKFA